MGHFPPYSYPSMSFLSFIFLPQVGERWSGIWLGKELLLSGPQQGSLVPPSPSLSKPSPSGTVFSTFPTISIPASISSQIPFYLTTMMLFRMGGLLNHASSCFLRTPAWSARVEPTCSRMATLSRSLGSKPPLSLQGIRVARWQSSRTQHHVGISEAPPSYC